MKPKNFPERKKKRREEAIDRQQYYDSLSPSDQKAQRIRNAKKAHKELR